jgi:hypothetical protein
MLYKDGRTIGAPLAGASLLHVGDLQNTGYSLKNNGFL